MVKASSRGEDSAAFIRIESLSAAYGKSLAVNDISLTVSKGEQVSILGPSGCGKTTTLRCIAGLESPTSGEIVIDGEPVFSSSRRIYVPPEQRNLFMMFQSYAIWPHMTVFENVAYGLRVRKYPRASISGRVSEVLKMVGMSDYSDRKATQLSGGQQQRVALARSYAYPPKALLLDEPLSNLDARMRDQVREDLKSFQRETGITTIYVTHDQQEAMALSDRIVVMRDGAIIQDGKPLDLYDRPRTAFVADFIGAANVLNGTIESAGTRTVVSVGRASLVSSSERRPRPANGDSQELAIRVTYPLLSPEPFHDTAENCWEARVLTRTILGDAIAYTLAWAGGTLRIQTPPTERFDEGDNLWLHIPPDRIVLLEG